MPVEGENVPHNDDGVHNGQTNADRIVASVIDSDDFAGRDGLRELDRICRELAKRGTADDLHTLRNLLLQRANRTYEKHDVPRVVAAALASRGPSGIEILRILIRQAPGHIYPLCILETLWAVSQGNLQPRSVLGVDYPPYDSPSRKTCLRAQAVFDDYVIASETDAALFDVVIGAMQTAERSDWSSPQTGRPLPPITRGIVRAIHNSSILLTQELIDEFRDLIAASRPEAAYQDFLESHPVFLDPLAAEMVPQARLGLEFVTDFLLRRHDHRYVAVEIEKPQDPIFTRRNDFTSEFSHAVGQVIDFQGWVAENVAYAQRKFPLIENPAGLLIIGHRGSLDERRQAKLRRWCANSSSIEILTFDDLIVRADMLLRSLRRIEPSFDLHRAGPGS